MADQLITGTTLVEKESRSIGDIPVGGIIEWDDTYGNLPDGFVLADGETINDPLSSWNGTAAPNHNTQYLTISGLSFAPLLPSTQVWTHNGVYGRYTDSAGTGASADVNLPDKAVVTAVVVYGSNSAEALQLLRKDITASTTTSELTALTNMNTEQTTVTNATVDNNNYAYFITTGANALTAGDNIYGARITYTPRNKFIMRIR